MSWFARFYLDKEKDIIADLDKEGEQMTFTLSTPNHGTGNLIRNLAKLCSLPLTKDENGLLIVRGNVPCYIDGYNRMVYIFRLGDTKVANIRPDGLTDCDFRQPAGEERIDNIAGAIAACGMLELASLTGDGKWTEYAKRLVDGLLEHCADWGQDRCGILTHCTASYHDDGAGRHTNIVYGDYFLTEALMRLCGKDPELWS